MKNQKKENESKEYGDQFYKLSISYSDLKFSVHYPGDVKESQEDFEWFKSTLTTNAKKICGAEISYSCNFYENTKSRFGVDNAKQERFRLYIDCARLRNYYDIEKKFSNNPDFIPISDKIDDILNKLPPRWDKTLQNKNFYRLIPSFAISALLATFALFIIFILSKCQVLPDSFTSFFTSSKYVLIIVGLAIFIILGFVMPNPNMGHYNNLVIDKKYKEYDVNWKIEHYENDINAYKDQVEFSVGKFYNSKLARQKINRNSKISLFIIMFTIIIFAILTILI